MSIQIEGLPTIPNNRAPEVDVGSLGSDDGPTGTGTPEDPSVATTALASSVGSVMLRLKDAYLRSVTFYKEQDENAEPVEWKIVLEDGPPPKRRREARKIVISEIGGVVALSQLKIGDQVTKINGKKIGPSYNAERATQLLHDSYERDGFLHVVVGNESGADSLVHATVIKPKENMTAEEMGLIVWVWGTLCIKEIKKDSIFSNTVLKDTDHMLSVNEISTEDMKDPAFHTVFNNLPGRHVQIVVRRGKQRWFGGFY